MKKIIVGFLLSAISFSTFASHIDANDCEIFMYGISTKETVYRDGSNNQFSGVKKLVTLELGVDESKLDSKVKRVGFQGLLENNYNGRISSAPYSFSFVQNTGKKGIWTATTELARKMMGENQFKYTGAFFVETQAGTYYWAKPDSGDYSFDGKTLIALSDFNSKCN